MENDVLARFGARLRAARLRRGLSQEKLSEKAGLHRTFVGLTERGEPNVTLTTITKLAIALETEMSDLMPGRRRRRGPLPRVTVCGGRPSRRPLPPA